MAAEPRSWTDGRLSGRLHTWVTRVPDGSCGAGCPGGGEARRITVAVTVDGGAARRGPFVMSTLVTDPSAAPAGLVVDGTRNPLRDPTITCATSGGGAVPCAAPVPAGSGTSHTAFAPSGYGAMSSVKDRRTLKHEISTERGPMRWWRRPVKSSLGVVGSGGDPNSAAQVR